MENLVCECGHPLEWDEEVLVGVSDVTYVMGVDCVDEVARMCNLPAEDLLSDVVWRGAAKDIPADLLREIQNRE